MTNISLNYDNKFLDHISQGHLPQIFIDNCRQALSSGEPGFSFNFGDKENETLRNACTEVTSADDSDVCNLGSVNLGAIDTIDELRSVVRLAAGFLVCGTITADLPYDKVYEVRKKNRRLGLGLMGIHEWLLKRGYAYEMNPELRQWLEVYREESERASNSLCDKLSISRPVAYRAIAPTGTIGIIAGTTTGIEPLFAVAYKRRYLVGGDKWKYEYVVDSTAEELVTRYDVDPNKVETSLSLVSDFQRRIKFQADVQDYVDMAISSTINMPSWGSEANNEDTVEPFARILAEYAPRLRGFTVYPDGARGGQPLTQCTYKEAKRHKGMVYEENSEAACSGGVCGL
jgi:ribonucleoside-diphosphate reductase alpha chain